ncbi:unnamed protein product (macronuclear) [Paramecium tetraurelia]|uniref:Uncharacterized protein n=1 Tax=Paramecium tetraurelia TaxID=5888 RepID=A0D8I8_PARTE|nr:uncharacterized protein GSPATT00014301001 [Paramecium tetraurelia]CAK79355.1 unnamed protein product [Paramecium tetraurelia]|eukprot:XP_001446752.1 hypothetical protein (macronuclear) [Paramecium tetraurelia strain d4-2]
MRNRLQACSFKNSTYSHLFNNALTLNKTRSCESQECGYANKKMLYVSTILPTFQPYQHIISKLKDQNLKLQQRKQIKMRNKRHLQQKKTLNEIMQKQDQQPKKRTNRHHNTVFYNHQASMPIQPNICSNESSQNPSKENSRHSIQLHRYNSLSPRKLYLDKRTTKLQTFSQRLKTFYLPITAPFDCQTIMRLEMIEDGRAKVIKQQGSQDDFEVNLRLYKFEDDDKNAEDQGKDQQIKLPTLHQEEDEEDDSSNDDNLGNLKQMTNNNQKSAYKNILKFNRRSLQSLIDKQQLGESRIKEILTTEYSQRAITANLSPISNCNNGFSPLPSLKLLDEKRKRPLHKLLPLDLKPVCPFSFRNLMPISNISPSTQSTKNSIAKKTLSRNIINVKGKKHKKNITFGQLLIKV